MGIQKEFPPRPRLPPLVINSSCRYSVPWLAAILIPRMCGSLRLELQSIYVSDNYARIVVAFPAEMVKPIWGPCLACCNAQLMLSRVSGVIVDQNHQPHLE